ncbi:MAG: nicotinate-nucleotide adenylyltransferase [Clostridia bacterium]|nr:nicotinate-nucleotide adenylyltransferase [Clostridia bacterium]
MKIGVFAGSFNPIHNAHIDIANLLTQNKIVDRIIFVPAGEKYEKPNLAPAKCRLDMVCLATAQNPNFSVCDIEIKNKKLFTYQTLDYIKLENPYAEICFIMGADNLKEFYWWKNNQYILENYKLIVLARNGQKLEDFPEYLNKNIEFVEFFDDLSSTFIRQNISNKKIIKKYLNNNVFEYIQKNNLYI